MRFLNWFKRKNSVKVSQTVIDMGQEHTAAHHPVRTYHPTQMPKTQAAIDAIRLKHLTQDNVERQPTAFRGPSYTTRQEVRRDDENDDSFINNMLVAETTAAVFNDTSYSDTSYSAPDPGPSNDFGGFDGGGSGGGGASF